MVFHNLNLGFLAKGISIVAIKKRDIKTKLDEKSTSSQKFSLKNKQFVLRHSQTFKFDIRAAFNLIQCLSETFYLTLNFSKAIHLKMTYFSYLDILLSHRQLLKYQQHLMLCISLSDFHLGPRYHLQ